MGPVPRALVLTDVVDSTRLTQALGDAEMARLWAAHDRAARDLLPAWRGREIDKSDGMLLLFDSAADATGWALAYQRALARLGLPLKARAGVHVGEVSLRSNSEADVARGAKPVEVDGLAKPVVARVMAAAAGGQTLLTDAAVRALGAAVPTLRSHGHWRFAGLADPVELHEAGDAGTAFVPPPDSAKAYRVVRQGDLWLPLREVAHSLPAERDSFVAREQPLQALAGLLADGARLVSVLGIGGSGKTRLALRFGRVWLGDWAGGVWFCDLAQARSLDGIAFGVAQGLGITLGHSDPVAQLAHAIAGRGECLLILDNFEQVAHWAEDTLGVWLGRAPQARFLVTSRERLGVVGERTLDLAPLPAADAATLFRQRAEAARQGWRPTPEDEAALVQLVDVLDGLPLAIELAAARVQVMSPRTMLARMHERFELLRSRSGRLDRQATLRAAFDWSWDLLVGPERAALAQLSVFRGGFTLEAASRVLDLGGLVDAVDAVQALVDKSLVRVVGDDRFDLLVSVREYAAERLAGGGPEARAEAERRHGGFFATLGPARAIEQSGVELENLVVACRRAAARADATIAIPTLLAAWSAIELRGPFRGGVELAETVRALPGLARLERVQVDLIAGAALQRCGRAAEAQSSLERAIAGARELGAAAIEGRALHLQATLHARSGRVDEAQAAFERALRLLRAAGERATECAALNALGMFHEWLGRLGEARGHYEEGLRLAREIGHRRWEGGSAGNLAQWLANAGRLAEARPLYQQAVQIAHALGDRQWEANARCNLGLLHFAEGRWDEAEAELRAALGAARAMGDVTLLGIVLCNLGLVAEAQGAPERARACHEEAVALARASSDPRSEGQFLGYLGLLHAREARFAPARECLSAAASLLRGVGDRVSLGIVLCARAEAEHRAGDARAAADAIAQAQQAADDLAELDPGSEFGQALARTRRQLAGRA